MTRHIAELERSLGQQLFVRTTRRVELTEAAKVFLSRCEVIVDAAAEAQAEVLGLAAVPNGTLRISLEADVGAGLAAPVVAEFLRRYPKVTVELDLSPRRVDLIAESFDLAVRLGALPDSSLIVRQVALLSVGVMDEVMAGADVKDGRLRRVLPEWTLPPVAMSVLTPGRLVPAKTRAFVELLVRQFGAAV